MIGIGPFAAILPAAWITLTGGIPTPSPGQPAMLPRAAGGWTRAESVEVYAGKDLFLLIDGGADLFFEYGFVRALTSEYYRPPDANATTELYEMTSPSAAYGLFTSFTAGTGTSVRIGQDGVLGEGYCIFWKGVYVTMITAATADSASRQMLLQLAGELEKGIRQTGEMPGICAIIREGGFESGMTVFIRGKLALGNHLTDAWAYPFPPTDGVVGTSGASRYMILEYADTAAADEALLTTAVEWEKLRFPVARDSAGKWTIQPRDEEIAMLERNGRYILAVSGGGEQSEALASRLRKILKWRIR